MSQAVIEFCDALKATLLNVEDRLQRAKGELEQGAAQAKESAVKNIQEASDQLADFKARAAEMAQALRADLPEKAKPVQGKLQEFGVEAQVALRHAVVFLAESAAKGAGEASVALQKGAHRAKTLAEDLRRDTAVTVVEEGPAAAPEN
jgi:hypothetical protein